MDENFWLKSTSEEAFWRVLKQDSPWHHLGRVDSKDCPITERRMASVLWQTMVSIKSPNHHVLVGPRRTGKTTILRQTVRRLIAEGVHPKRIWELQMDDAVFKNESLKDIVRIMVNATDADHNDPLYLMIDEIAHASNWQIWLKLIHDKSLPVKIAATSSAAATLTRGRVESGFGRWKQHYIFPSQINEYLWLRSGLPKDTPLFTPDTPGWMAECQTLAERLLLIPEGTRQTPEEDELLREYSLFGGLPEFPVARGMAGLPNIPKIALTAPEIDALNEARNILKDAVLQKALTLDLYLEGEEVRDTDSLRTLANYLAFAPSQKMSVQNLCNLLDVTRPTIGRWLTFLEDALIIFRLYRYSPAVTRPTRSSPKLYFVDHAMPAAESGKAASAADDPSLRGHLLENMAASALLELKMVRQRGHLGYWSARRAGEVDLIYDDWMDPLALEIGSSASNHSVKALKAVIKANPAKFKNRAYLVTPDSSAIHPADSPDGIGRLPMFHFLLAVAAQCQQHSTLTIDTHSNYRRYTVDVPSGIALPAGRGHPPRFIEAGEEITLSASYGEWFLQQKAVVPTFDILQALK